MKITIEDAASACLEVNVEDVSSIEDCIWLTTLMEYLEYQHDYCQTFKHYAKDLECLVEGVDVK